MCPLTSQNLVIFFLQIYIAGIFHCKNLLYFLNVLTIMADSVLCLARPNITTLLLHKKTIVVQTNLISFLYAFMLSIQLFLKVLHFLFDAKIKRESQENVIYLFIYICLLRELESVTANCSTHKRGEIPRGLVQLLNGFLY